MVETPMIVRYTIDTRRGPAEFQGPGLSLWTMTSYNLDQTMSCTGANRVPRCKDVVDPILIRARRPMSASDSSLSRAWQWSGEHDAPDYGGSVMTVDNVTPRFANSQSNRRLAWVLTALAAVGFFALAQA